MSSSRPKAAARIDAQRPDFVHALAKGLRVLETFERGRVLGIQDLIESTGLPKTTVSRLAGTLASLGYLRLDERTRKYSAGARMLGIGSNLERHLGLQSTVRPLMDGLARRLDVTVILSARAPTGMVLLDIVRPPRNLLTVNNAIGAIAAMTSTSMGLAYLVAAPLKEQVRVLEAVRRKAPEDWERTRRNVERANADYRQHGFVVSHHAGRDTISGVGVPLVIGDQGVFALSCSGPSFELTQSRLRRELGPALLEAVRRAGPALAFRMAEPRTRTPGSRATGS